MSVLTSLAGGTVSLLMWPFPQVIPHGSQLADVWLGTQLGIGVALVAGLATWLTDKRHPALWVGELLLAMALAAAFYIGLSWS